MAVPSAARTLLRSGLKHLALRLLLQMLLQAALLTLPEMLHFTAATLAMLHHGRAAVLPCRQPHPRLLRNCRTA